MATKTKTAALEEFTGFREEAFRFLRDLKKNNDRDWFQPRKPIYEKELQAPMLALVMAVDAEMRKRKIPLAAKAKAPLSRIYRDIRFSADKSPYQTMIGATLHKNGKKEESGVIYIHIGHDEQFAAAGFWQSDRPDLTNWRLRMLEKPQEFLGMLKTLKSKKIELSQEYALKRMPRGFESAEGTPIEPYLRLTSFVTMHPIAKADAMSGKLPALVTKFAVDALPLLEYGWQNPRKKPEVFLD